MDNIIFFYLSDSLSISSFCSVKSWHFLTKCYFLPLSAIKLEKGIFLQVIDSQDFVKGYCITI